MTIMNIDHKKYDIIIATDCRFPGGTSVSVAEEITAQARAGYKTGLLHVPRRSRTKPARFNHKLLKCVKNGSTDILFEGDHVDTQLLVLRHPNVFRDLSSHVSLNVSSEERLMIANQSPADDVQEEAHYDPQQVHAEITRVFGDGFTWAPIGPLVRQSLEPYQHQIPLADQDWVNILDTDSIGAERTDPVGDVPVIGRHGRDAPAKWPHDVDDLLAAYPNSPDLKVRVLGGADTPKRILGTLPQNWEVIPYGSEDVSTFLGTIDFFVYHHHPQLNEAFGRTIIEAMAAGVVTILPEHFKILFKEAALYREPEDTADTIQHLYNDWPAYLAQSQRAKELVRQRFSYQAHIERIENIIAAPSKPLEKPSDTKPEDTKKTILFMSSNGVGMGHLTRLMAMASRASSDIQPVFFTLSQAVGVVYDTGFPVEYLPSNMYLKAPKTEWNSLLEGRLHHLFDIYEPEVIVFDGTNPYDGLLSALKDHSGVKKVWSRRGMWRTDNTQQQQEQIDKSDHFDLILDPGEWSAEADKGLTAQHRHQATSVKPITLLDRDGLATREKARQELGIPSEGPAVLMQFGSGSVHDVDSITAQVLNRLIQEEDLHIFMSKLPISTSQQDYSQHVIEKSIYPLSRYLHAFDFAISSAGYNAFHELVNFGLPTLFIPTVESLTDDQPARAHYAEHQCVALSADSTDIRAILGKLERILEPGTRQALKAKLDESWLPNGAGDGMKAIEQLLSGENS